VEWLAITFNAPIWESSVVSASVIPAEKYSSDDSWERLVNGTTASERTRGAPAGADCLPRHCTTRNATSAAAAKTEIIPASARVRLFRAGATGGRSAPELFSIAKARSLADWKRRAGSFSRQRRMMGVSGVAVVSVRGSSLRIAFRLSTTVSRRNGLSPVNISYMTMPNENRSLRASACCPRTCSGAM
jgi:hypothetical protein